MQMHCRLARATHVGRDFAKHVAGSDPLLLLDHNRVGIHVQVFVNRAVVGLHPQRRPIGNIGDDAVSDGDRLPLAVIPRGRPDILALVANAGWAQRHVVTAHFAVIIALDHWIIVLRVVFAAARRASAAPAATAEAIDLGIHMRKLTGAKFHRIDNVGQINPAVVATATGILRHEIARRIIFKARDQRRPRRRGARRRWRRRRRC